MFLSPFLYVLLSLYTQSTNEADKLIKFIFLLQRFPTVEAHVEDLWVAVFDLLEFNSGTLAVSTHTTLTLPLNGSENTGTLPVSSVPPWYSCVFLIQCIPAATVFVPTSPLHTLYSPLVSLFQYRSTLCFVRVRHSPSIRCNYLRASISTDSYAYLVSLLHYRFSFAEGTPDISVETMLNDVYRAIISEAKNDKESGRAVEKDHSNQTTKW